MKERLDVLLVNRNMAETREKAKAVIMAGCVYVNNQKEDKAGSFFQDTVTIEIRNNTMKYVSRGGYKLEKMIEKYHLDFTDKICMDIGSSTGGFTDCMLQSGASKVYSIDVGTNQLAWKLRQDPRVVSMEKTNIRYVTKNDIPDDIDFASIDVSFISLTKILDNVYNLLSEKAELIMLIKPQFEAGRENVGKKGVVRDPLIHKDVINKIIDYTENAGFVLLHLEYSPIRGPEGNIEYLLYCTKFKDADGNNVREDVNSTVESAHNEI